MRRTKAQAQETRESLLRAALDTFALRGVTRTSLHEIARAAGVTRGAFYWHFKNKEDLFDALFQHIFDDVCQPLDEDIRTGAPDMLETLRHALVKLYERQLHNDLHRKFSRILHLQCEHTEDNAAILAVMDRYLQVWRSQVSAALTLCVQQGTLPADLDIAAATLHLKSQLFGLTHLWLLQPEVIDLSQAAPRTVDAVLHTLQHAPSLRTRAQGHAGQVPRAQRILHPG